MFLVDGNFVGSVRKYGMCKCCDLVYYDHLLLSWVSTLSILVWLMSNELERIYRGAGVTFAWRDWWIQWIISGEIIGVPAEIPFRSALSWAKCETEAYYLEPNARQRHIIWAKGEIVAFFLKPNAWHKRIILSQMRDRGVLSRAKCMAEAYYLEPSARRRCIILNQMRDRGVLS